MDGVATCTWEDRLEGNCVVPGIGFVLVLYFLRMQQVYVRLLRSSFWLEGLEERGRGIYFFVQAGYGKLKNFMKWTEIR